MTSWYDRHIVPRIIKVGCGCEMVRRQREKLIPGAAGRVLEIGFGSGHNLQFYDPGRVSEVVGVEPSDELREFAKAAPRPGGLAVDLRPGNAEALPFEGGLFDTVVTTFTLCSVADPVRALAEARRVLKPGGHLLFCEHGLSPDQGVAKWQGRIEPIWKRIFGGCHLTRPVGDNIARHFAIERIERGYMEQAPRIAGWVESGVAIAG
jgi:ubiquinone/menaquinone biosynthesis C-methylase UbiE